MRGKCGLIAGCRGSGKTTLAKLIDARDSITRSLTLDPMQDYAPFVDCYATTGEKVEEYCNGIKEMTAETEFSLAYTPTDMDESQAALYLIDWAKVLRNCRIKLDEAHGSLKRGRVEKEALDFIKRCRHFNVDVWAMSQRPSDIDIDYRAELKADEAWFTRLTEDADLDMLTSMRGKEFAEAVKYLPRFQALRVIGGERQWEKYQITPNRLERIK